MRTEAEIVDRINLIRGTNADWAGFRQEVLFSALSWEALVPYLREGLTEEEKAEAQANRAGRDEAWLLNEAQEYFHFAIGKIIDHRGISASRSVEKLTEFAWLMGKDDLVKAMDETEYSKYGAPIVLLFGRGMGFSLPKLDEADSLALDNMANGVPCMPDCEEGC